MARKKTPTTEPTESPALQAFLDNDDVEVGVPEPEPEPEQVAPAKPGLKTVTCPVDLRVVTQDFVVIFLKGGVPRQLSEKLAYEAQGAAAKAKVGITIE